MFNSLMLIIRALFWYPVLDRDLPSLGPPYIRDVGPVSGVEGSQLRVQCPVSGYPIDKITWEKGNILAQCLWIQCDPKNRHLLDSS